MPNLKKLQKLIIILGPTASGKTNLAIRLAKKLAPYRTCSGRGFYGVEIVSADSRQVYKGMDIGTAKPTKKEMRSIPHHLVDIIYPDQEFNVAIYKKMALIAIKNIRRREKLPFLVGGTGLYIRAIVENIDFPKVPPQKKLREKLEKETEKELFKIYKKLDPEGAKFIERENKRRLIRAIEVCEATKKPFWQQRKKGEPLFNVLQIGIKLSKKELKERVEKRIEKMFKMGLEKEVKNLSKKYGFKIAPMRTIGYQEWQEYFKGKINKEEVKKRIVLHTLQFVRRQMTWFKREKRIKWIKNYQQAEQLIREFIRN